MSKHKNNFDYWNYVALGSDLVEKFNSQSIEMLYFCFENFRETFRDIHYTAEIVNG